jgi:hypothetical protein
MWSRELDMIIQQQPKVTTQRFGGDRSCKGDPKEDSFHITKTGEHTLRQDVKNRKSWDAFSIVGPVRDIWTSYSGRHPGTHSAAASVDLMDAAQGHI